MNKIYQLIAIVFFSALSVVGFSQSKPDLKVYIIRHGEKPIDGDNLTCKGLNRAMQLPAVLKEKVGIPDYIFVPSLTAAEKTKHARMFETVVPFAVKYNLKINSSHTNDEYKNIAEDIKSKKGTVLMVWEHKALTGIIQALGVKEELHWADDDFDSMWIITITGKNAILAKDAEGLHPQDDCSF
ncbi:MAG: histidine phosphatase family protein [Flavipsychrobacter sp.]|nr:histidine phosphatase family protein [Flavipsychrobacter sp.]